MTGRATARWAKKSGKLRTICRRMVRTEKAMLDIRTRNPRRLRARTRHVNITAVADMWSFSPEVVGGWVKMPLFKEFTGSTTPPVEFGDLQSIQSHQEDYRAKLGTMLIQHQAMVDKKVKYLETVRDRMRELRRRARVPAPRSRFTTGSCSGVFGEAAEDLEDSCRRSGAH